MCFNAPVSLLTFFIGMISSIILVNYGSEKYKLQNLVVGIFFMFIASVQLMEYIFWIDLDNKMGLNKIASIIGPLLIFGQPVIFFLIKILTNTKFNYLSPKVLPFIVLNIIYTIYLLYYYSKYISNDNLITNVNKKCSLLWPWTKYYKYGIFYLGMLVLSGWFAIDNTKYFSMVFLIIGLTAAISFGYFKTNFAELWCFFSAFAPFIFLGVSKSIN